jgi:ATP-dependent Clp protease adapter protein ClpS
MVTPTVTAVTPHEFDPGSSAVPVIVVNDDESTFEWVAGAIAKTIPGVDHERGMRLARAIHENGHAVVWAGDPEQAWAYQAQLAHYGLTIMNKVEQRPTGSLRRLDRWLVEALWPGYSIFWFGVFALIVMGGFADFGNTRDAHRVDVVLVILSVLSVGFGVFYARRAKRRAAQREAASPQRVALTRELAAAQAEASPRPEPDAPGASGTPPLERPSAEHTSAQVEHLVTDDEPNTSLCGIDQTGVAWNQDLPICEACKAVADGRLQRTRAGAD